MRRTPRARLRFPPLRFGEGVRGERFSADLSPRPPPLKGEGEHAGASGRYVVACRRWDAPSLSSENGRGGKGSTASVSIARLTVIDSFDEALAPRFMFWPRLPPHV